MTLRTSKLTHSQITNKTGGISRNMIRHVMLNAWTIPQDYAEFIHKKLKAFSGNKFRDSLTEGQLYDPHTGLHYNVIYQDCTPVSAKKSVEVLLSFRSSCGALNLEPIVLVRISKFQQIQHPAS